MLEKILNLTELSKQFLSLKNCIEGGEKASVFGASQSEKYLLSSQTGKKCVYVASDFSLAQKAYEDFKNILGDDGVYLLNPQKEPLLFSESSQNEQFDSQMKILYAMLDGRVKVICASVDSLFQIFSSKEKFLSSFLKIKVGNDIEILELSKKLSGAGYKKMQIIDGAGQYSVRGDIVDIFPVNSELPYRFEFFDTQILSVKTFDVQTQKSIELVSEPINICPKTMLFLDEEEKTAILSRLNELKKFDFESPDAKSRFDLFVERVSQKIESGESDNMLNFVFPLLSSKSKATLFDYLDDNYFIAIDESKMVYDQLENYYSSVKQSKSRLLATGEVLPTDGLDEIVDKDVLFKKFASMPCVVYHKITSRNMFFDTDNVFEFKACAISRYTNNIPELVNDLTNWIVDGYKIYICAGDDKNSRILQRTLNSNGLHFEIKRETRLTYLASAILPYELSAGFSLPNEKIVVVGTDEVFAKNKPEEKKTIQVSKRDVFTVPKVGDFVVHSVHGIGICEGITRLTGKLGTTDYVVVKYRDNDKLYVPIDQMDLLDRYMGGSEPTRLSKIGGTEFGAVKERTRKKIRELAFDLLKLYAEREKLKGFAFAKDDDLQAEFEASFPYTETEDQLNAIKDVKVDMERARPMDRLICGDVGFGKTEVALRAIFKAVISGKQVAFMVPTTILAEQHFNTCKARLAPFGVSCAVYDRFRTPKELTDIENGVQCGKVNVIIGTQKLLSKKLKFYDLGLIVLDEEQKFGVEDKEKLKVLKSNVDVLTLSATPIPRTLHMSLSGIRDVSIIATPPRERIPVQTSVIEFSDNVVKEAITRELERGGKCFIVYNRVEDIQEFAFKIRQLVPQAKIVVGHGQMPANVLEDVICEFAFGSADVLISTTIIENGIDITSANTLIVIDSNKLGLSSLYQIRGRVGRSNKSAFAYFTYDGKKTLTPEGYKRLEAISEFTEFGSGFKIAMRDLEIRGSGSVLGAEQHGHIEKVGYDLYCKMIAEEVEKLKGNNISFEKEVLLKIELDAFVPDYFIEDQSARLTLYKNISRIESIEERDKILQNLRDLYGDIPKQTANLIDIALVKALAKEIGVDEVYCNSCSIKLVFEENGGKALDKKVLNALNSFSGAGVLNVSKVPTITFEYSGKSAEHNFGILKDFLIISTEKAKK